jgi:prepilin-type N-terminal cleavage/methylation domain-containing protein
MSRLRNSLRALGDERGFTLIELIVAMSLGLVVSGVGFSLLDFTTTDVSRISDRVHVDQAGRVALEKLMLALHSSCVSTKVTPIRVGSNNATLKFVSETSPENKYGEPSAALTTVKLHEIIYTPGSGKIEGTLTENSWSSTNTTLSGYTFNEKETPIKRKLLTGIKQTENGKKELVPIFRYYRYYREGDAEPKYGQLNPNEFVINTKESAKVQEEQAKQIAKVSISYTISPEGSENKENTTFGKDRPVALEDSAVLRLESASEESKNANDGCEEL